MLIRHWKCTVPYTPDLNPIENAFSVIKNHVRYSCANNIKDTKKAILGAIPLLTTNKLRNMRVADYHSATPISK